MIHRIHLRGPWDVSGPWADAPAETIRSVTIPQTWEGLFGGQGGAAVFGRWFHQPTNLASTDRLAVVLTGVAGSGQVWLNDVDLGAFQSRGEAVKLPFTLERLQHRNRLRIELTWTPGGHRGPGGLFEAVAIQIESES